MDSIEPHTHSFIVKIWRERTSRTAERYTWRGKIAHVPDGEQRAIRRLVEIIVFIAPYLLHMRLDRSWKYRLLLLIFGHGRRSQRRNRT
jgi:hypothetical protein